MRLSWIIWVGPTCNNIYFKKWGIGRGDTYIEEGGMKMEAEAWGMQPQATEAGLPPETGRGKEQIVPESL